MNVIIPTTITTSNLLGSSILENEYSEWEAGGFVAVNNTNYNFSSITRASSGNMYACLEHGAIYKSTDNGVTWGAVAGAPNADAVLAVGTNIYACNTGNKKIYMDTGESGTFNDLGAPAKAWSCMCVSTAGDVYAGSSDAGIYKQTGGTGAFAQINSTVRNYKSCTGAYDGSIYFAVLSGSIFRSADGCVSLTDLSQTSRFWYGMTADANGHVYACAFGGDVYKRTNGTGSFVAIGGTSLSWYGMCYDEDTDTLYGCVYGGKVYSATGTTIYSDGDHVQITSGANLSDHRIYESLVNNNASNNPATDDGTKWLDDGNTMRTKCFDGQISIQTTASESMTYVFAPGEVEAIAFMNLESSTVDIIEIDNDDNLILNGTDWTGASGTTQPTSWDKVGTPTNYTIDSGALKLTVDGNEGISQTIAVSAATEYQLLFLYKNTASDVAQVAVYDVTHSADILATTDLASKTSFCPYSYVFTTPAGCVSIKISLTAKTSGDIVWFDYVKCAPTKYSETITTGALISYACKTDLWKDANCILTVNINNTGATAKIGEMVMGLKYDIGGRNPNYGISWGGQDWSTIEQGTFGYEIVERDKSKWMRLTIDVPEASWDYVSNLIQGYMSSYLMWLGSETNQCLMIYGFPDEWSFTANEPSYAVLDLSIKGIP